MRFQNVIERIVRWWNTRPCTRCGGTGGLVVKDRHGSVFLYDCNVCDGKGRVPRLDTSDER